MLQGTFLVFSAGVIFANLIADCLYFYLDPRVQATMSARAGRAEASCRCRAVSDRSVRDCCSAPGAGVRARCSACSCSWPSSATRIAPYDPDASSLDVLAPPSSDHLLGTTENGADVFSQLLVGARVSIVVGFAAAVISAVLGSAVGLLERLLRRLDGPRSSTRSRTGSWSSRRCR